MPTQRKFDCGCITDLSGGPPLNLCQTAQELRRQPPPANVSELHLSPFALHFIDQFDPANRAGSVDAYLRQRQRP